MKQIIHVGVFIEKDLPRVRAGLDLALRYLGNYPNRVDLDRIGEGLAANAGRSLLGDASVAIHPNGDVTVWFSDLAGDMYLGLRLSESESKVLTLAGRINARTPAKPTVMVYAEDVAVYKQLRKAVIDKPKISYAV